MAAPIHKSKYKNVFGQVPKEKYLGIRIANKTLESPALDASSEYIVFPWDAGGGGIVAAIQLSDINNRSPTILQFKGHKGTVQDIKVSPFYDGIFATTSDDATVKLWEIPSFDESGTRQDAVATLTGHDKRVLHCVFNPVSDWILASGSHDNTARTWNLETRTEINCFRLPDAVQHIKWNYTGSLLAVTSKDKLLRILDPRASKTVAEVKCHEGAKASKLEWLGGSISPENLLFTAGFEKGPGREGALWDLRAFNQPLQKESLGRGAGSVFPYWDSETGLMLLPGRGDGNIKIFEIYDQRISVDAEFRSAEPAKNFGVIPKRAVDIMRNEVLRLLKADTATSIQAVEFIVPRKSTDFQGDLYPPCLAGEPALSASEWLENKIAEPVRMTLSPTSERRVSRAVNIPLNKDLLPKSSLPSVNYTSNTSAVALQKQLTRTESQLKERTTNLLVQHEELEKLKLQLNELTSVLKKKEDEEKDKNSELQSLKSKIQSLETQLKKKTEEVVQLQAQQLKTLPIESTNTQVDASEKKLLKEQEKYLDLKELLETTQKRNDELEKIMGYCKQAILSIAARQQ